MGNDCAAAFVHDGRMRNIFGIANVHDAPDHVISIFLKGVIRGAVEIAARSVVINPEPAANIEITELMAKLGKFCVIARCFAHCAFDRRNVGNLRTDMKMNQLQTIG